MVHFPCVHLLIIYLDTSNDIDHRGHGNPRKEVNGEGNDLRTHLADHVDEFAEVLRYSHELRHSQSDQPNQDRVHCCPIHHGVDLVLVDVDLRDHTSSVVHPESNVGEVNSTVEELKDVGEVLKVRLKTVLFQQLQLEHQNCELLEKTNSVAGNHFLGVVLKDLHEEGHDEEQGVDYDVFLKFPTGLGEFTVYKHLHSNLVLNVITCEVVDSPYQANQLLFVLEPGLVKELVSRDFLSSLDSFLKELVLLEVVHV